MLETKGGTRNRTQDLPKKGSAFILSSDHMTECLCPTGVCSSWHMPAAQSCEDMVLHGKGNIGQASP